jgi:serine/threonine-protein kinase
MEFIEGSELKKLLRRQVSLSIVDALQICVQILEALEYAHQRGVIHRDIKPANIMLLADNRVKVADFGVAHLDTSELTATGYILGTPAYMAPETLRGEEVGVGVDIYAVGMLLLELLSGVSVRLNAGEKAIDSVEPLLTNSLHPHPIRDNLIRVLHAALAPSQNKRFNSANRFRLELLEVGQATGTIISETVYQATRINRKPDGDSQPSSGGGQSVLTQSLSNEVVSLVERCLTTYIGPLARHLVKKKLQSCLSIDEFTEELASHIPNKSERNEFLANIRKTRLSLVFEPDKSEGVATECRSEDSIEKRLNAEQLDAIAKAMGYYMGPLAKCIVKKHAGRCGSVEELLQSLAGELSSDEERDHFVRSVSKLQREK